MPSIEVCRRVRTFEVCRHVRTFARPAKSTETRARWDRAPSLYPAQCITRTLRPLEFGYSLASVVAYLPDAIPLRQMGKITETAKTLPS
jgi:hypothetical protein